MNTLTPLLELLKGEDFDGAHAYANQLHETEQAHQWRDFNGMTGRIQLIKTAMHRDLFLPSKPFLLAATDEKLRGQILFSYRVEAQKLLKTTPPECLEYSIERAAQVLVMLTEVMSEVLPQALRGAAQMEMIQITYKSKVFPRVIALNAERLEAYRDSLLELDLGL